MSASYRKSPRLEDRADYLGPLAAHVILVTRLRKPLFSQPNLASECIDALERSTKKFSATVHAYCIMPDHAHVLVEVPEDVSLQQFVHHFKTISSYQLKRLTGEPHWQISYYDHILRREEALGDLAAYIWANPVKAGLVQEAQEYPWSGPAEYLQP
jgi:REP element-mobilizing transposase RayT